MQEQPSRVLFEGEDAFPSRDSQSGRSSWSDTNQYDVEQYPPKRESVSRPGLQLDGSLNRSSHYREHLATRSSRSEIEREDRVSTHERRDATSRDNDRGKAGRGNSGNSDKGLLARSNHKTTTTTTVSSKPSKLEFERAKRLLARRWESRSYHDVQCEKPIWPRVMLCSHINVFPLIIIIYIVVG